VPEQFTLNLILPASCETVYTTLMNAKSHADLIDSDAAIEDKPGTEFSMWEGYITGKNLELVKGSFIRQSWRTADFPEESPDSMLEIRLVELDGRTKLTLVHSEIPDGQGEEYKQGWFDFYFDPLLEMFS
jgi:activator of HSP90 ATPase